MLSPQEIQAIELSLRVALWSVAVSLLPGVALAWLLARRRFVGKALLDALVHLPLVLPPVVTGYVLLLLWGRGGPLYGLGPELAFTWRAAVLASAVVSFPLLVRSARLGFELADPRLDQAAATLGASPLRTWLSVTLPLASPGVLAGVVLCFARSLGEFGATITFAGNLAGETRTLPLAVFSLSQIPGDDGPATRLVVVSAVLALAAMLASELLTRWLRRRLGAA